MLTSIRSMPRDAVPALPWPQAGHRNFSTTLACRKNHRSLRCGTRLQANDCVRLERAPRMEQYRVEPHVLTGTAGTAEHPYAPHFLIAHEDGRGGDCEVQASVVQMPAQWMKPRPPATACIVNTAGSSTEPRPPASTGRRWPHCRSCTCA